MRPAIARHPSALAAASADYSAYCRTPPPPAVRSTSRNAEDALSSYRPSPSHPRHANSQRDSTCLARLVNKPSGFRGRSFHPVNCYAANRRQIRALLARGVFTGTDRMITIILVLLFTAASGLHAQSSPPPRKSTAHAAGSSQQRPPASAPAGMSSGNLQKAVFDEQHRQTIRRNLVYFR